MIIGICGKARSGKDTVSSKITMLLLGKPFYPFNFANNLKRCCAIITNTPISNWYKQNLKNEYLPSPFDEWTYRSFMQQFGTNACRNILDDDIWINSMFAGIDKENIIISDVRFINEAAAIKDRGGIIIKVQRDCVENMNHQSETEIDDICPDYILDNNYDFEHLNEGIKLILKDLKLYE